MNKVITLEQVTEQLHDGMSIMIGGFLGIGAPLRCIEKIVASGVKDLTIISIVSSNPPGGFDIAPLFKNKQVKKYITSHIGTTEEVQEAIKNNEIEVELFPMGTWTEKIRCGGYGLGGALTPVGIGTKMEDGKQIIEVEGKKYILEVPLRADLSIIKGYRGDTLGNIEYRGASINSNPIIAAAADFTIAEVNEIVAVGDLEPIRVGTPSSFVKAVVQGNTLDEQEEVMEQRWIETNRFAK